MQADTGDLIVDYPTNFPYETREIRLMRLHMTAEAARAAVLVDVEAFKRAFPDAMIRMKPFFDAMNRPIADETPGYILRERFADSGHVGCIISLEVSADAQVMHHISTWLALLDNAASIERRHNVYMR